MKKVAVQNSTGKITPVNPKAGSPQKEASLGFAPPTLLQDTRKLTRTNARDKCPG